jgi:molybdate transport system substrate-binding protein
VSDLKLLSTLATKGALGPLLILFTKATGIEVGVDYGPTNALVPRLRARETADVTILTRAAIDELAREGLIAPDTIADVALSRVGIAVRAGARKPDIASVGTLKAALLGAKSIAYSKVGASGVYFARLIEQLGIADAVNTKARITSGLTAKLAASGEVELAVQQVSELMQVTGVDIVGPLPAEVEPGTIFSAAVLARSPNRAAADRLIAHLASPRCRPRLCGCRAGARVASPFATQYRVYPSARGWLRPKVVRDCHSRG